MPAGRACDLPPPGLRKEESAGHGLLAHAAGLQGDLEQGCTNYATCLVIARELGDGQLDAESLNNIATCLTELRQPAKAQPLLEEALPLARASGHRWTEAAVLSTLGDVEAALGRHDAAHAIFAECLALCRQKPHAYQS